MIYNSFEQHWVAVCRWAEPLMILVHWSAGDMMTFDDVKYLKVTFNDSQKHKPLQIQRVPTQKRPS